MPRGDGERQGQAPGAPRRFVKRDPVPYRRSLPQYIPPRLAERIEDFEKNKLGMLQHPSKFHRPGSQKK